MLAGRRHGVITWQELLDAGLSPSEIKRWIARGRLHRLFRGVYLLGHASAPPLAWPTAALLAAGRGAVLSHHTAAHLHGFGAPGPELHVTTPSRRRSRIGLRIHSARLGPHDVRITSGLCTTTPIRTLTDLILVLDQPTLERCANEAQALGRVTHDDLANAPLALRRLTEQPGFTRREAERRLKELLHRAGMSPTATNARVRGYEADVLFAGERLVVEMDSFAFHRTRRAFERDRRRDAELTAAGYRTIRVTWRQIEQEPERVVATIAAARARSYDTRTPSSRPSSGTVSSAER